MIFQSSDEFFSVAGNAIRVLYKFAERPIRFFGIAVAAGRNQIPELVTKTVQTFIADEIFQVIPGLGFSRTIDAGEASQIRLTQCDKRIFDSFTIVFFMERES